MINSWMNVAKRVMRNTQKLLAAAAITKSEIRILSTAVLAVKFYSECS